eukprot:scaffold2934_cov176-Amphora_coffeaeformis.AAC.16
MKVELSIHALKLKNVAGAFKGTSDPFAVITLMGSSPGEKPRVLGKTEVIKNNLSPQWVTSFSVDYEMGTPCKVAINIFDEVRKGDNKSMGSALFEIGEVLGESSRVPAACRRGNTMAKKMKKGGTLFVVVRKAEGSGILRLTMKGIKLKNVEGMFSKSDPFYELSRKVDLAGSLTWDNVMRSEVVQNNLNPEWDPASIELSRLCGGNLDAPVLVSIFDYERKGEPVAMGSFETSVNGLLAATKSGDAFQLTKKGKPTGGIVVSSAEVSGQKQAGGVTQQMAAMSVSAPAPAPSQPHRPSASPSRGGYDFVDYVSGGLELNVVVAIDFTGSNGDPRQPGTLHHLDPSARNDYQKAIAAIVGVLSQYDSDQQYPVLGFGAKYGGVVRHCFQCGPAQEVKGVQGVLDAYRQVDSPLSVVIVGVGNADFSSMQFLDDFGQQPGHRDIANFVQFNMHSHNSTQLTKATLQEIPEQVVSYFQKHSIPPGSPLKRSDSTISIDDTEEEEIDLTLDIGEDEIVVTGGGDGFVDGFNSSR